jgi:hypothetical protein
LLYNDITKKKFSTIRYVGKASSLKLQLEAAAKLVIGQKTPVINGQTDSVSGLVHIFLSVGSPAKASLAIDIVIAKLGSFVKYQRISANPDRPPQI